MAIHDIKNNLTQFNALSAVIASDTTTAGAIFDTADYELGFMVGLFAAAYTDGTYTVLIEESDDSGMSGAVTVSSDKIIGTQADLTVTAVAATGDRIPTVGVFSNLRYVRVSVVSVSTTTGATIILPVTEAAELVPDVV